MSASLVDGLERQQAATTFDQNVVVTAGAGTGKTTLLVDRLVNLLMRERDPVKVTELVALTFTNKAADEMRIRLRQRLQAYGVARLDREPGDAREAEVHQELRGFIQRYHLGKQEIDGRAIDALRHLERSEIGTIHSFAASLLRLYPVEAGLDPQFREDDGSQFERHFEETWNLWLDRELSSQGLQTELWKTVLRRLPLERVRELACALCPEPVDLTRLAQLVRGNEELALHRDGLKDLERAASSLIDRHPENRVIEQHIRAGKQLFREFLERGAIGTGALLEERALLALGKPLTGPKGWDDSEVETARGLVRVARRLATMDREFTGLLCDLLVPFVQGCREQFTRAGFISFDGLLVRARQLLREHPRIREELKGRFKAILVDEFQDTDPVQYEVLLYLAEEKGSRADDWRSIRLQPGKLFVVGDPKQSIYAFRRADIEAHLRVVRDVIEKQNGLECTLKTSFRSHAGILNAVNALFSQLIKARHTLQPPYVAIQPPEEKTEREPFPSALLRGVEIRRVEGNEGVSAEEARTLEGESLARWLGEEVLDKAVILDKNGSAVAVRAGHVAILLRSLVNVDQYLEPLRRRGIPYVVEGEKHFYSTQEVIDMVNLLRAVENPYDRLALAGVLRSPLGGLDDGELYELHRQGLLDYRAVDRAKGYPPKSPGSRVRELYVLLNRLHTETPRLPVGEAVGAIFDTLPVMVLAASSFHGAQRVANLEKVRLLAEEMGRMGSATLKGIIATLEGRISEMREEGESSLAEEGVNAVKILSVHKAKGLEFPLVILAGCHAGVERQGGPPVEVYHDWSANLVGLHAEELWSLSGIFLEEKKRAREQEEQKRVFYVAATRAREHLTFSCAATKRGSSGSFVALLEEALGEFQSSTESRSLPAGAGRIELTLIKGALEAPEAQPREPEAKADTFDWRGYRAEVQGRNARYQELVRIPSFVNPTLLKQREEEGMRFAAGHGHGGFSGREARLVGDLAHGFLQGWNFSDEPGGFSQSLSRFLKDRLAALSSTDRELVSNELETIFAAFSSSPAYRELRDSRILGREIPLLIPWGYQVMEGVLDLLYEKDGVLYVADYKTDRVSEEHLTDVVKSYHHQAEIYCEAVRRSL
ncbi:MAG TPA: UvrD-helicase domain-containing protein, partial [Candidatus Binatia bacterium]